MFTILQPKPTKGKMRIHCLENVDKALSFLYEQRVHLENLGAHDIVDGHARLTLGLIWTIILRFQIQEITIDAQDGTKATRSAKDALLVSLARGKQTQFDQRGVYTKLLRRS